MNALNDRSGLDISEELTTDLLVRFLRSEAGKFGFEKVVCGLSGGVDSAVAVALAARAFGPANILGVMMPYRTSNPSSEADARIVADSLGISTRKVDISDMADGYLTEAGVDDRMRRGNVMARCRMVVLYDLSVEWRGLVLGTSNKTEILLGYEEVDRLLVRMIDERWTEEDLVAEGFSASFFRLVAARIAANQYKRLPPIIAKLGPRSVTHDFRYLRSWGH
jgi:NH3-dependent NAD+ synthetase